MTPPDPAIWRGVDALIVALENECRRLHARHLRARGGLEAITGKLSAQRRRPALAADSTRRAG